MSAASRYIADGSHAEVRWYVERPADMPAPLAVVTLQTWHGPGRTYVSEVHEVSAPSPATIVRMADTLLARLEAKARATARRVARLRPRAAVGAVLLSLVLGATGAQAQRVQRSYDAHGRETGSAELRPDGSVRFRDAHGRETGRSEVRSDGSTRFYDEHGRETGTVR